MKADMKKKIMLVAGARPNFMKIAPLYRELRRRSDMFEPVLVHTGQHYDVNMSDVFFRDLEIPEPDVFLGVGSGTHAEQTAAVMVSFEKTCLEQRPDMVVVVGDVNSTMACAITAVKLGIPVAHVEAGLRSCDRSMPEEINRLVTDSISDLLLTPSPDGDENLLQEGCSPDKIHRVGNIMIDSLTFILPKVRMTDVCSRIGVKPNEYGLITLHRPANVDTRESLEKIVDIVIRASAELNVVFPMHPRTSGRLETFGLMPLLRSSARIILLEPLGYTEFMNLLVNARLVLTDSGGIQEETTYLGIPCLTLRPNTERPVTITEGTNELTTFDTVNSAIEKVCRGQWKKGTVPDLWDGMTAKRIVDVLGRTLSERDTTTSAQEKNGR
jgi:UDP-N-acetylglucosamine 2-epimerase (non-hydrolysing)